MIEPMKKVTVVCMTQDRDAAVDALAELGIVHVVQVTPPESDEIARVSRRRDRAARALRILDGRDGHASPPADITFESPREKVDRVLELAEQHDKAQDHCIHWLRVREDLEHWGSFSRELLDELRDRGLQIRLCSAIEKEMPDVPEGAALHVVSRYKKRIFFAVIAPPGVDIEGVGHAVPLPEQTDLRRVDRNIAECRTAVRDLENEMDALAARTDDLKQHLAELTFQVEYAQARDSMGSTEQLAYLQGFVPERDLEKVGAAARQHGWAVQSLDPEADDEVPTKISLPKWIEPIRVVFHAMGIVPGYREFDISMWFMIFLSIFFAMLIGDAAYGALFLAGTLAARMKFKHAPPQPFWLIGIFSVTTIVWGVLTGTYFGIQHEFWGPLARLQVDWLTGEQAQSNLMRLCFFLGAIHLAIAHFWNAIVYGISLKGLREVGWGITVWGNFFLARMLVTGDAVQDWVVRLYVPGLAIVVLVTIIREFGFVNILLMAFGIINAFVDVVSYIRLYAVGMATVAVAQSFNNMAADIALPIWIRPLPMILILILGHALNMALAAMSVLVHGVRLNVLEFAQHLGLEWKGMEYRPLARHAGAGTELDA